MIDSYLASDDETALRTYCAFFVNVIGPEPGREDAGDPAHWYACIRAPFAVPLTQGIVSVSEIEGEAVLGSWA
jgi:hypothetical protein